MIDPDKLNHARIVVICLAGAALAVLMAGVWG
jgi:hypothetical protein